MKISFSIGGQIDRTFNNSITNAITGLSSLQKKEDELKNKQSLIGKFKAQKVASGKLSQSLRLQEAKLRDLQTTKSKTGATNQLLIKEEKLKEAIAETNKKIVEQGSDVDNAFNELKKAGINTKKLEHEEKKLKDALDLGNKKMQRRQSLANGINKTYKNVTRSVKVLAGASIAASIAGFKLTSSFAEHGDQVAKTADKLGIGTTQLQKLRYAAERSGMTTAELDKSMEFLQKNTVDAANGTGEAKKAFDEMGISALEMKNLKPEQALALVADKLKNVENKQERLRYATQIFGRSGAGMVNMLKDGSDGLKQLGEDAEQAGYILDEKALRAAEDNRDAWLNLKTSLTAVTFTVANNLMPIFTDAFKKMSAWIENNRETINKWVGNVSDGFKLAIGYVKWFFGNSTSAKITRWGTLFTGSSFVAIKALSKLSGTVKKTWKFLKLGFPIMKKLGTSFGWLLSKSKKLVFKTMILGIKGIKYASIATKFALKGLSTALLFVGRAMLANPIGLAITGITLAITAIVAAVWYFKDSIISSLKTAWEYVSSWGRSFVNGLSMINQALGDPIQDIVDVFSFAWTQIKNVFSVGADFISGVFSLLTGDFAGAKESFANVFDGIKNIFTTAISFLSKKFQWIKDSFNWIAEKGKGIWDWLTGGDEENKEVTLNKNTKISSMQDVAQQVREKRAQNQTNNNNNTKQNHIQLHNTITIQGNASKEDFYAALEQATQPMYAEFKGA